MSPSAHTPPAGQTGFFSFGLVTRLTERKTEFKPTLLHLKNLPFWSHPTCGRGVA